MKFLGLEYSQVGTEAKLQANTRGGSRKEFTLANQLEVHLRNERDLLTALWAKTKGLSLTTEVEELPSNQIRITKYTGQIAKLVRELTYSGARLKPSRSME